MTKEQNPFEPPRPRCFQEAPDGGCANKGLYQVCENCIWAEPGRKGPPIHGSAKGRVNSSRVAPWKE